MKRLSKYSLIFVLISVMLVLTSCGDKTKEINEYKAQIEALEGQVESLQNIKASLEQQMQDLTIQEVVPESSLRKVEGTRVPVFETIDGVIKFPNALILPDSKDDVNNSNIRVGSRYTVAPSSNWMLSLNGVTLNASHPSKIWGSVKAVTTKEAVLEAEMQPILQSFFDGFPATTISYRKIFIEDRVTGMLASAPLVIDGKDYTINVGFSSRGENAILMLFAYEHENVGVQQELVDLLIRSMRFNESNLKLE